MKEVWKDIQGYEGLYQVSSFGNVFSCRRKKCIKLRKTKKGYFRAHLSKEGHAKDFAIHRLVANAFLHNPDNLPQVNHKDEDKANNRVDNLEWCTQKDNVNHGTCMERTHQKQRKRVLCVETGVIYPSVTDVAKQHNYSISFVANACRNIYKYKKGERNGTEDL